MTRRRLALLLAGLALALGPGWAVAAQPRAASVAAQAAPAGKTAGAAEVQRLRQAVSAGETRRRETQRRLQEQDREIQSLRRQLEAGPGHDSVRPG